MHWKLMRGRDNGGVQVDKRKDWLNIEEIICNVLKPRGRWV